MNAKQIKIALATAGFVLGLSASLVPITGAPTATEGISTATSTIDVLYPLFAGGISWTSKVSVSLPPRSTYNPTDQTIAGYQVTSLPSASTQDIGATVEPLRNYYDKLLVKNGWKINNSFEADGPGGSLWGFTKGNNILIFSYTSTFMNQTPGQPEQCPCTVQFTLIGGVLK